MSHAEKADKLLIKPAAGARPAPPCRPDGSFPRHARRPVTRRVTSGTETTRLASAPDRPPAESHSHPSKVGLANRFECPCHPKQRLEIRRLDLDVDAVDDHRSWTAANAVHAKCSGGRLATPDGR